MPEHPEPDTAPFGDETTRDAFLGGLIEAVQPVSGHRSGTDAVFLAAAALDEQERGPLRLLDAGAGSGVAGLCLLARFPNLSVTAVERNSDACALARANGAENGFSARYEVIEADLTAPGKTLAEAGLKQGSYQRLIANPPFYLQGAVRPGQGREDAHVMAPGGLEDWARFLAAMAAPEAILTMIHRPDALAELVGVLGRRFGDLTLYPLFPKQGAPASRVLIQGRKGRRGPLRLRQGLVLHEADGRYTEQAEAVLRHGEALPVAG
ncbi:N5-glutamine S-adenosyl-L-methionine-dependent methyltransferase [Methyloligella halotolerans]|uniref:N5-glutamine S-adenosyl-L-methionine-dependent methyltransferase n=1 Tax=Methyloligella halotolerans TaxID=1177755 RepID=A0A1E2RYU1_9HYPH|nr:methyltransferase [Methyloligella halotolerans]ODA67275.1 N5-glutamine S-adenosyl-L-methionine-dependent methyltransferase [Methyloligella halotolerans]